MKRWAESFRAVRLFCTTLSGWLHVITHSLKAQMHNTKSESTMDYGNDDGFIDCNKCTTRLQGADFVFCFCVCVFVLFFWKKILLYSSGWSLVIFLAQPPECWDYRCILLGPV
jgi:hypothetical protein